MAKAIKAKKTTKPVMVEEKPKSFKAVLFTQMLTLATSGFGLVAALAWNETIQGFVKVYIEPRIPGSGLISQFFYAIIITVFAVLVTYQLSRLAARFSQKAN